ncbi:hypothetical protein [Desulfomarina profundi]|nr:hypothetical protein [Desulfomarina profundi]
MSPPATLFQNCTIYTPADNGKPKGEDNRGSSPVFTTALCLSKTA